MAPIGAPTGDALIRQSEAELAATNGLLHVFDEASTISPVRCEGQTL